MQRKIKKKLRTAQISRSKQFFFEHGLGGGANQKNGADVNSQRSIVNGQWSTVNGQRSIVKETKRRRDKERKRLSSLKVCTVSKSACHNGQSAALLSDSGLVMYFSTLPAPSSSVPCILTILTHLKPGATPPDSMESSQYPSLEGCTPAKMAARAA